MTRGKATISFQDVSAAAREKGDILECESDFCRSKFESGAWTWRAHVLEGKSTGYFEELARDIT